MSRQKLVEFGTRKDPRRGSGPTNATGSQGAPDLEALFRPGAVEHARDVAGGEGVSRSCAIDELDGKPSRSQRPRFSGQNGAVCAAGNDDRFCSGVAKNPRLF